MPHNEIKGVVKGYIPIKVTLEQLCNELALTNLDVKECMKEVLQVPDI
jgi:hypothetical protein